MKFEEIIPALREGKKVKRSSRGKDTYLYNYRQGAFNFKDGDEERFYYDLSYFLDSDDWEIIKETKKVKLRDLTKQQYIDYWKKCDERLCCECPLLRVECDLKCDNCWFKNKDLYNDKFLDQEVEIEEE